MNRFGALFRSPFGRIIALTLLVFTLLPMIILTALSAHFIQEQLQERSISQMAVVSKVIQQVLIQWTSAANDQLADTLKSSETVQNASLILTSSADATDAQTSIGSTLSKLPEKGYFDKIFLVQPDGSVVFSTDQSADKVKLNVDLAALSKEGKAFWGFDSLYEGDKQSAITWQPILDQNQKLLGFLVGHFDVKQLELVIQKNSEGIGKTGETYLVDINEEPITSLRYAKLPVKFDVPIRGAIKKTRTDSSSPYQNYSKEPVFGAVQAVQAPLVAWLVVEQKQSEAYDSLYEVLRVAIILAVIIVILAIIAAILTTQNLLTPLQTLTQAANKMAGGDLKTRVPVVREDEIGSLAFSFNTMATGLERAFADLESSNKKLRNRASQLNTITRVGQHIVSLTDFDQVLNKIVTEIQQTFGYYAVTLLLINPEDENTLSVRAAAGIEAEKFLQAGIVRQIDEKSLAGSAALARKTINVKAVRSDVRFLPNALRPDTLSEVSIPLLMDAGNVLLGVLDIQSDKPAAFTTDDLEILQILADQIAIGIRNADLLRSYEVARQAADEANRQKSEFLSNMSHELRTPLNVIIGYSHSILNRPAMYEHVPLPSVYQEGIASIMNSGQHLLGLINDILDLSKIEAGQIDLSINPVDPTPILQGVRSTALGLIKKNVQIRVDFGDELPWIMGDELRIRQMLLNLVSNAAKFTEQGFIRLDARPQDNKLLFIVEDTGAGIPDEAQPYIFQRFRQASKDIVRKHGGTGLGLNICRQLALLQGGEIWFESTPGKGTTFYFTIPMAPETVTNEQRATIRTENAAELSSRVSLFTMNAEDEPVLARQLLVLDTHSTSRNEFELALSDAGYEILVAETVDRAITIATAFLPDLLIVHRHKTDDVTLSKFVDSIQKGDSPVSETTTVIIEEIDTKQDGWSQPVLERINTALSGVTTHIAE